MLKNPGACLVLMSWWIVPFFVIALFSYPLRAYVSSYVPFLVALVVISSSGILMNVLETKFRFWSWLGHWSKCLILIGSYALAILVILILTLTLDSYGLVGYFDGDAEGSFGMLYIPSAIFYLMAGAIAPAVLTGRGFVTRRQT